jgi:ATP-binding cassette subfamily C protein LapB
MALPLAELESREGAFWQALFRDVDVVRNTLSGPTALLVVDLPFAILFLGLVLVLATPLAWVLAVILPTFVLLAWRSGSVLSASSSDEKESGFSRDAMLSEIIAGRATVKALALDDDLRPLWESKQADTITKSVARGRRSESFSNLGSGLSMFATIAMTTVGTLAIINGQMTIGALIASNMLTGPHSWPIQPIGGVVAQLCRLSISGGAPGLDFGFARRAPRDEHSNGAPQG